MCAFVAQMDVLALIIVMLVDAHLAMQQDGELVRLVVFVAVELASLESLQEGFFLHEIVKVDILQVDVVVIEHLVIQVHKVRVDRDRFVEEDTHRQVPQVDQDQANCENHLLNRHAESTTPDRQDEKSQHHGQAKLAQTPVAVKTVRGREASEQGVSEEEDDLGNPPEPMLQRTVVG